MSAINSKYFLVFSQDIQSMALFALVLFKLNSVVVLGSNALHCEMIN